MEELSKLLRYAEEAQQQTLHAVGDDPSQVARLKDPVLLLLDVLGQCKTPETRHETLQVLFRLFTACSAHFHDSQAFLETPADATPPHLVSKRGNAVLKALLGALRTLSSREEMDEDILRTLVDMAQQLCTQSMNAADVVALFDFLRLGRPPVRCWVLQMQKKLVELDTLPRAIFTMRGPQAGVIVPSDQQLFSKRGFSCSFGIHLDACAAAVALYSFRGQNGQGVSAMLDGKTLVVKMVGGQGVVQQVEVPFSDYIDKMEMEWVHLCIVHAKKMVFKDKLAVFVDGRNVFNGNLGYPDPLMMVGGRNTIGIEPLVEGLKGKLWSPTLFGVALSEAEVQRLHWLTHWKNDLNSVAAENAGLTDKSKICFSYDARSCDLKKRICYDVSGNDCNGTLGSGTSAYVTQSFIHALDSVGGCTCFLLLLLDQIPEMADFHPVHEFRMGEISDLLAFVGAGLRHSTVCRSHFARLQGVKVVEFILQSISPSYLSVSLLDGVVSILEAMADFLDCDEDIVEYIYRLLFFNTSWFLSPFDTQTKLLGEVLPKYLEILQNASLREQGRLPDIGSPPSSTGKIVVSRAASLSEFSRSLDAKDQVDVGFFCTLIRQVYTSGAPSDKEEFVAGQMDEGQLAQLRELVIEKLMDILLFPSVQDAATDQWRQLVAFIFRQCEGSAAKQYCGDENTGVEEILRYLTRNLASTEPRKVSFGLPTRQLQLSSNVFKLSKGTVRILWKPMLSTNYHVRLAALRLFELYISEKVLLHKSDMLMLYSSLQAHTLTVDIAELLLDIVIGRKRLAKPSTDVRSGSYARMTFIPTVLLGLIHNGNFDVQAKILAEIRVQFASPTMGDSIKEAIRSWPSWMSRLRSLTLGAGAASSDMGNEFTSTRERSLTQSEELNEACSLLSAEATSAFAKLEAIQVIAGSGDVSGCDFALSLIQNRSENEVVTSAIIAMVIKHFPQRWCELVRKLANQIIVDIVVYCILHVRNGWMHFLEFYFCHCCTPSDLCSLTAVICEHAMRQVGQKHSTPQSEIIWENLCQVAAIVSQSPRVALKMSETLDIKDAILASGQQVIIYRKAFELWQVVLPHLKRINWDALMANLVQNADYGPGVAPGEVAIFSHLVASRSRSMVLALQTAIQHVTLAQANGTNDVELIQKFRNVLELLKLIAPLPVVAASRRPSGSLSPLSGSFSSGMSPPVSGSVLPDMVLSLPLSGITDSAQLFSAPQEPTTPPDRELAHMYTLDACFTLLEVSVEGSDIETVRLLVNMMVLIANTALHLRDSDSRPELTKTLQIMSSTELAFFSELSQFRELCILWKLHREKHQTCCESAVFRGFADELDGDFMQRWMYTMEQHSIEFNPFLVQQHASSQAEALGHELQHCEFLWKEISDENEAAEVARTNEQDLISESRLVELKHSTEKFASSVHKLLTHSSHEVVTPSLFGEGDTSTSLGEEQKSPLSVSDRRTGGDGIVLKIDSRENNFRMRLRLKKVTEEYRARNLSCEYPPSSLTDTESKESGRRLTRRFRGSMEGNMADLENSWRSDAGSDYSDFLADAQMRAAIIRSLSNPEEYESAYGGASDDDDLDAEEIDFYDAEEDNDVSHPGKMKMEASTLGSSVQVTPSAQMKDAAAAAAPIPISGEVETPTAVASSPSSLSSVAPLNAASPMTSFSLGASVMTVVGGVADYFQKSVKDAKDAVEYSVDTLYTTKDTVSEEAQALMQEVSTYIDSTAENQVMVAETVLPDIPSLELTPSSLKMMESNLASGKMDNGLSELSPPLSSARSGQQVHEGGTKRVSARSKVDLLVNAQLVRHLHVVEGKLILSSSSLRFVAERVVDEHETVVVEKKAGVPVDPAWRFLFKRRRWKIDDVVAMYRRRYLLKPTALELFIHSTRKNYFFNLSSGDVVLFHEALMLRRPLLLKRDPSIRRLRHPSSLFRNSSLSTRWVQHEISTFEYIMWLNTIAGRTYNDLTQYPVFPWIISDYESATLDLSRRGTYRDLSKPMGALEPSRLKFFVDRYNAFEDPDIPKFMYGTHYSNIGAVLYYLIRLEPFTSYGLSIQGGKFDHADRLFHSVAETWNNCLTDYTDLKELTPEWFYLPEFLVNCNKLELGTRQNGADVSDVILPPWAHSPEDFVMKNLVALESEYVSANIHHWIDLVFGCKQRGAAAVEANNVFFYLTYEGMVDVDSITDPIVKSSMQSQIAHFGQTPTQVLREPHPQRRSLSITGGFPPLSPPSYELNRTVLSVPHEAPIVLVKIISGSSLLICLDSNGMLSSHRSGSKLAKQHQHQPSSKPKGAVSGSSPSGDQFSELIELQDRKSRKVLGEKRFLSSQVNVSNLVAFLHGGMVLCTVGYHDFSARFHSATDGALLYRLLQHQSVVTCVNTSDLGTMLALGCTDGTISVWKVANMNSTLLDSLKIFRGSKASSKPVHANDYSADQVLLGHNAQINCVKVSDELGVCVSGSASNECLVHDLEDGSILHSCAIPGHLEPGVISLALSNVGHVVLQSMGTGTPMLYSFHLNGTMLAKLPLGEHPMTSIAISARYSKVIVSNCERALVMTAHTLDDQQVLLEQETYGEISSQGLAPDEMHVVFGVGSGKIVCLPFLPPQLPLHRTEM
ncbi:BEACH domain-containing protein lvsC [Phytophthora citrophthora]|uniref:BEACH domain-containing protein lvsC n=1 Tax=Phytophthora citrophthora TaxID=4793 RepID=A0AAD9LKP6_9STRA|nr:BEACH domain-containing protein lvsC [Phytophthora citrophthora]